MNINITVFILYLLMLIAVGYITFLRTKTYSDYAIAGRTNNKWVTAISASTSDMSGWLLLGLPGMAFVLGFGVIWVLIGILFGTLLNWTVIANRLRIASEKYDTVSLSDFYEKRLGDKKGIITLVSGIVIVVFMIINSSAEIIGSGKLLNVAFGFDYQVGILISLAIVLIYTFLGGFLAVSWSNLIQGAIVFFALILVPLVSIFNAGSLPALSENLLGQSEFFFNFLSGSKGFWEILGLVLGGLGIGIGYPGQPHVLTNFMAIKDPREIKDSTLVAMIWVALSGYGAVIVGMVGRAMFPLAEDPETIFLILTKELFPGYTIGLFAAAVMAAILSSVSAYLLVASSSFAANIFKRFVKVRSESQQVWVSRIVLVVISLCAYLISLSGGLVFEVALYAWGGLAACFGPLTILSLYWSKTTKQGAIWSMIVGMVTIIVWYNSGLSQYVYELIPGFILSFLTLYLVSKYIGGPGKDIENRFLGYLSKSGSKQ